MYNDYMDDNNVKPLPPDQDEAAKKYQEILDKYATDLESNTIPPEDLESLPEPVSDYVLPPVEVVPPQITPSPVTSTSTPVPSPGIFKYLFYLSLLIFLFVLGAFVYTAYKMKNLGLSALFPVPTITIAPLPIATPTPDYTNSCDLNGKKYLVGETFKAFDGCNTCTCGLSLVIDCTLMACSSSPSSDASPSAGGSLLNLKTPLLISNFFDLVNKDLGSTLKPVYSETFFSPTDLRQITKDSWKLTYPFSITSNKPQYSKIVQQLETNNFTEINSAGGAQGTRAIYQNSDLVCEFDDIGSTTLLQCALK